MQYLPLLIVSPHISIFLFATTLLLIGISVLIAFKYGRLYIKSITSNAHISLLQIMGMSFRNADTQSIVEYRIMAKKAGIDIAPSSLESHDLAGGNIGNVVRALIAAGKANIDLNFDRACAIDLAGRDVFDAVKTSINPKVIDCPDPSRGCLTLDAVTKDGIQLKVKARITVRTKIERLVGGATEETVIARIGEGIITTIGSTDDYRKVLERPDLITTLVMGKGLDADTAFQILSVNIVAVEVGSNIGARLQADQADTDKRVALGEAEKRQSMAIAHEQEMKALAEENMAKILAAEAEVPKAIAQAFREGNLGIMDYYQMKNIKADTDMRTSISKSGIPPGIK
jgi:uncharacterized protein YqfA (UPF0365 family)